MALMGEAAWRGKIFWAAGPPAAVVTPRSSSPRRAGNRLHRDGRARVRRTRRAGSGGGRAGAAACQHRAVLRPRKAAKFCRLSVVIEAVDQVDGRPAAHAVRDARGRPGVRRGGRAGRPSRYGELLPSDKPRLSRCARLPVGVVGVISPFNVPLILSIRSVAPALALGNAVVLKPDLRTAVSGGFVLGPGARGGRAAGRPAARAARRGRRRRGAGREPAVRVISFTGSTAAGRQVGELAARHLKRVHLELGGNSALIVLDDADLDAAVSAGAWGSFLHQGQICMTDRPAPRARAVADAYVAALAENADHLPVGDPTTDQVALGPLIDAGQRDKVHRLVTATVDAGATLAAGGTYDGLFYRPTVLDAVAQRMPAYAEEVFGPVAPVIRFPTVDEAAQLAADTEYGLSLGILTRRRDEGPRRWPTGSRPASCTSTTRPSTTRR